jgi:hypothetical protein
MEKIYKEINKGFELNAKEEAQKEKGAQKQSRKRKCI